MWAVFGDILISPQHDIRCKCNNYNNHLIKNISSSAFAGALLMGTAPITILVELFTNMKPFSSSIDMANKYVAEKTKCINPIIENSSQKE
jgi:hypothetical protein